MKHLLFPLVFLMLSLTTFAGENWKTYYKTKEVEIQYCEVDCHDDTNGVHQRKILLKITNRQNKKVEVYYTKELTFSNKNVERPDVREFSVTLEPNATIEGSCNSRDNRLFIFSKQLNFSSTELKKFELKNISVKPIIQ